MPSPAVTTILANTWAPLTDSQRRDVDTWLNANLAGIRLILDEHISDGVNAIACDTELSPSTRRAVKDYMLKRLGEQLCDFVLAQ